MSRPWRSISDYEVDPANLSDKELAALSNVWIERREALGESRNFVEFIERLKRQWAIETGLIERLYTLDRGITESMIEHGINAALIPHGAAVDKAPRQITAMIGDQQDAVESVFAFVKGERKLSTSYIKELHRLFTRNQEFVEARDQFGRNVRMPLVRGDYKKRPNNPSRQDGLVHEYCPPEHVAAEMERLIELHSDHEGVAPEVEAAWLHHRFTQIHPFEDGNGRIARALATLVFVKADWLPLVVRDSDRKQYIDVLESADNGDLKPLVSLFSRMQKAEFIRAIGIARDTEKATRVHARIESIKARFAQRRDRLEQEWHTVISAAQELHIIANKRLEDVASYLLQAMREQENFSFLVDDKTDSSPKSYYFRRQIISSAKTLGYYANLRHYRSWVRLVARDGNQGNILISFHCIGHEFQGVMACSGTWFLRTRTDEGSHETEDETALCDEVFQFNYKENIEDLRSRFQDWLERVLERGLALWELSL